jgi:hypothetical protein
LVCAPAGVAVSKPAVKRMVPIVKKGFTGGIVIAVGARHYGIDGWRR